MAGRLTRIGSLSSRPTFVRTLTPAGSTISSCGGRISRVLTVRVADAWTEARHDVSDHRDSRQDPRKGSPPVAFCRQRSLALARYACAGDPLHRPPGRLSLPPLSLLPLLERDRPQPGPPLCPPATSPSP